MNKKYEQRYQGVEGKDYIYCLICKTKGETKSVGGNGIPLKDRRFFDIFKHLSNFHKISKEEYLSLHPGSRLICEKQAGTHRTRVEKFFGTKKGKAYKVRLHNEMLSKERNPMFNPEYRKRYDAKVKKVR